MISYLHHIDAITASNGNTATDRALLNLTSASAGAVLLAGLKDAYDQGGFGAMVAQFDTDAAATAQALSGHGMTPDVTPFAQTGGRA